MYVRILSKNVFRSTILYKYILFMLYKYNYILLTSVGLWLYGGLLLPEKYLLFERFKKVNSPGENEENVFSL